MQNSKQILADICKSKFKKYLKKRFQKQIEEALIFAETKIIPCSFEDKPFCLSLAEPFAPLMLACSNDKERQTWLKYFLLSIQNAKKSFRQYAYRRNESQGIAKKKYFILSFLTPEKMDII